MCMCRFLDRWCPSKWVHHLPQVYQALLLPMRIAYAIVGPCAASALGVSNPAVGAEFWIHQFPVVLGLAVVAAAIQAIRKSRQS